MNATMMEATLRQRLASPVRVMLVGLMLLMPLGTITFMPQMGLGGLGDGYMLALVLAAGLIGQDLSSGVLQLLFARPVRRSDYVTHRWFAVGLGATALSLARMALGVLILAARRHSPSAHDVLLFAANDVLVIFGLAALVTLFSSLLPGFGDLALLLVTYIMSGSMQAIGQFTGTGWASRIGAEIGGFIAPRLDLTPFFAGTEPSWFAVAAYLSTVTACLALAIVVLNRRELSYASTG